MTTAQTACGPDKRAAYRQRHKAKLSAQKAAWVAANRDKRSAHYALQNALRTGKVTRPSLCSECGLARKVEAHHADYSQPLRVTWLCRKCHFAEHGRTIEHATILRGSDVGTSKLTVESARAIREKVAAGAVKRAVAREFGVSESLVRQVASGQIWRHV